MRLSKAQRRALNKAIEHGYVMRAGGFSDAVQADVVEREDFDRPLVVDRLIAQGLLKPGEGYNQYEPTERALARRKK